MGQFRAAGSFAALDVHGLGPLILNIIVPLYLDEFLCFSRVRFVLFVLLNVKHTIFIYNRTVLLHAKRSVDTTHAA